MKYAEIPGARHLRGKSGWTTDAETGFTQSPPTDPKTSVETAGDTDRWTRTGTGTTRLVSHAPGPERLRRKRMVARLVLTGLVTAIPLLVAALFFVNR